MSFDLTILTNQIEGLKKSFDNGRFADALVASLNTGNGRIQQRIFTDNVDIEGNSFGVYIGKKHKARLQKSENATQNKRNKAIAGLDLTSYQRKRASKGRQVLKKDLEFTGGERRSIETQVEGEKAAVIQFNNDKAVLIARGQEAQITNIRNGQKGTTKGIGIKIFQLNESERNEVIEQGAELIKQILK